MSKLIKKLAKDIPFYQERGILKESRKFAENNGHYYDSVTENMLLNAMIEIQRASKEERAHIFTSLEIVEKLEKCDSIDTAIEYYKQNWKKLKK